jgi:hypothetical protein
MDTLKKKAHMVVRMARMGLVHNLVSILNLEMPMAVAVSIEANTVVLHNMDCILAEDSELKKIIFYKSSKSFKSELKIYLALVPALELGMVVDMELELVLVVVL